MSELSIPGRGIHAYRFAGLAIVDVVMTVVAGVCLHWAVPSVSWMWWTAGLFAAGIVAHRYYNIRTTVDKWLFP